MKRILYVLLVLLVLFSNTSFAAPEVKGGLIVSVGGNVESLVDLRANDSYLVHALYADASKVALMRKVLVEKGLYGKITCGQFDGKNLPYVDNLVNQVVVNTEVDQKEVMRVLAPMGVALIDGKKIVKPWPAEIDEWTHYLYDSGNNAVGQDKTSGYPRNMQWAASPMWARHHDKLASMSALVTTKGRLYYIVDRGPAHSPDHDAQWQLEARDAFNGILLWTKPMKSWVSHILRFRSGPVQLARLLVADKERIFVAMGINEPVSVVDGNSGDVVRELKSTAKAEEIIFHNGTLLVIVGNKAAEHAYDNSASFKEKALVAVNPDTGKLLWRYPENGFVDILPQTLAAAGSKVVLQEVEDTVCLNLKDGKKAWAKQVFAVAAPKPEPKQPQSKGKKKKKKSAADRKPGWAYNTLVVHDDVVLTSDNKDLYALSLKDGKALWDAPARTPFAKTPSVDILVIDGVVWSSPSFEEGRDLRTGEVKKTIPVSEIVTAGHHHRCYRNKGNEDFVLFSHRGVDFLDTKGDEHSRNNWVRGVCQYGVMPANGVLYAPPHNCGCYPEAILRGFWALAPTQRKLNVPDDFSGNLEKGSAFAKATADKPSEGWLTYRGDPGRSGVVDQPISLKPEKVWQKNIGGSITAPVSAEGLVLLASRDTHTVYALDENSGKEVWSYIAGGQVNSPPTIYKGTVLFGAADGKVYSLSLKDGALRWCFDAAPAKINSVAFGSVESLWPVHGSILVNPSTGSGRGIAYFVAGRNSYLDEGLFLFGLDAVSGEVKYSTRVRGEHSGATKNSKNIAGQRVGQNATDYKSYESADKSDAFSMEGNIGDIMLADDDSVYLRHMRFNDKLQRQEKFKHHLFSTSTFIDGNEAHRAHFFYGNGNFHLVPVAYEWITRGSYGAYNVPASKLMIYDGKTVWGAAEGKGGQNAFAFNTEGLDERYEKNFPAEKGKPGGEKIWTAEIPIHARAILKAGENIVMAGSSNMDQLMGDAKGGMLVSVSAKDGAEQATVELESVPIFDGMAVANGKLFMSMMDGSIVCYK